MSASGEAEMVITSASLPEASIRVAVARAFTGASLSLSDVSVCTERATAKGTRRDRACARMCVFGKYTQLNYLLIILWAFSGPQWLCSGSRVASLHPPDHAGHVLMLCSMRFASPW